MKQTDQCVRHFLARESFSGRKLADVRQATSALAHAPIMVNTLIQTAIHTATSIPHIGPTLAAFVN